MHEYINIWIIYGVFEGKMPDISKLWAKLFAIYLISIEICGSLAKNHLMEFYSMRLAL